MNDSNWDPLAEQPLLESVRVFGVELRVGDRVRLWPQKTADIMDMALKGHGATVRYVTLPFEAHGYAARQTLLHILAERINWFDKYVKNAGPRATTEQQGQK